MVSRDCRPNARINALRKSLLLLTELTLDLSNGETGLDDRLSRMGTLLQVMVEEVMVYEAERRNALLSSQKSDAD